METKSFFDVFPTLELTQQLREYMEQTQVERTVRNSLSSRMSIYVKSPVLIDRQMLWDVERALREQIFDGFHMEVRIRERFELSAQYTAKSLMELYEESFLTELKQADPLLFAVYKRADITYPQDNRMVLTLEDVPTGRQAAGKLLKKLEKILTERCGLQASVSLELTEPQARDEWQGFGQPEYAPAPAKEERASLSAEQSEDSETVQAEKARSAFKARPAESTGRKNGDTKGVSRGTKSGYVSGKPGNGNYPRKGFTRFNAEGQNTGKKYNRFRDKEDSPQVLYGRSFAEKPTNIIDISDFDGELVIAGEVVSIEDKPIKNGEKKIVTFSVYDGTDTINVKVFMDADDAAPFEKSVKAARYVCLKGSPQYDKYDKEITVSNVRSIMVSTPFRSIRQDEAAEKRCELHTHTKMSDSDGISEVGEIVKRAYQWGMPGIAITDHAVVQSLTDGGHAWEALFKKACEKAKEQGAPRPDRQDFFKLVLGMECYLVDDEKVIVENSKNQSLKNADFVVFDIETTGFSPIKNKIIEIGAVRIEDGKIVEHFDEFINPEVPIPYKITKLTSITDSMVMEADTIDVVLPKFVEFAKGAVLVGHNVSFDMSFINENCKRLGIEADYTSIDTLGLSRAFFPRSSKHNLDTLSKTLNVELTHHHRADADVDATAGIFLRFLEKLEEKNLDRLDEVNEFGRLTPEAVKHLYPYHATILAKNTVGRVNLYRLVSISHLEYVHRYPLIPKSVLKEYREGLLIGAGDSRSEAFEFAIEERSEEALASMISFYDYLEVQPEECHIQLVNNEKIDNVNSLEDVREINRRIVQMGERFMKPVIATSDMHFLDPEEQQYRTMLLSDKGFSSEADAPLYLRTTDEMLNSFAYLGADKAKEIVITTPRRILDTCDSISPVRPDKCPPTIEDSDKTLRQICYDKAHAIYGDPLPGIVEERLEKELTSIIGNGFAVMYISAQKLVWKSNEDGYIVGSRGSVGSSFVAFAAGITEVNSLPPHYICPECKFSDFESEDVKQYELMSGCDMPDKECPRCGRKMKKDGFNIPFETFLGFKGDKEPDIDLNFSTEYQKNAHKYTEVIFGEGQTFKAGTVSALQDNTAYKIIKKYLDNNGIVKRKPEMVRLCKPLIDVRRGTSQHPGGIIVLPKGDEIHSFTPIQHPANKMDEPVTTHFDYHSIDHNLLKLDILGHQDPTMIRRLYDLSGIDPTTVPLDDPLIMRLFQDTSSLHVTPEQLDGVQLGCLGLPEFGTDNAMQMVLEAKPTSFTDLIRISGLSHGTDVWHGNERELILGGTCTIDKAICNRDDIMNFLISKGVDKELSFKTMESVRKGKGLTPEMKEAMIAVDVPQWYIDACLKIQYMFPKAHATAYVMNAWRQAWFKVHEPLAFYAAWFSVRTKKAFSYFDICVSEARMKEIMKDYKRREKLTNIEERLSDPEKKALVNMRMALEMYERGYEFMPIDIFRAHATRCQVIDGKIMPPLISIDDMGDTAAEATYQAAQEGPFLSRDDFKARTKCPQKVVDRMAEAGMLGDIPETNQLSFFDFMKQQ